MENERKDVEKPNPDDMSEMTEFMDNILIGFSDFAKKNHIDPLTMVIAMAYYIDVILNSDTIPEGKKESVKEAKIWILEHLNAKLK